jgi:hypothetical protein
MIHTFLKQFIKYNLLKPFLIGYFRSFYYKNYDKLPLVVHCSAMLLVIITRNSSAVWEDVEYIAPPEIPDNYWQLQVQRYKYHPYEAIAHRFSYLEPRPQVESRFLLPTYNKTDMLYHISKEGLGVRPMWMDNPSKNFISIYWSSCRSLSNEEVKQAFKEGLEVQYRNYFLDTILTNDERRRLPMRYEPRSKHWQHLSPYLYATKGKKPTF